MAVAMTQQYLAGELSVLLARLQAVTVDEAAALDVARLRREAETGPLTALGSVAVRALALDDGLCWACLARGDPAAFDRLAVVGTQLRELGVCSGLLPDA